MSKNEDDVNVPVVIEDDKTSRSDASAGPVTESQVAEVEVHSDSQLVIDVSAAEPASRTRTATPAGKKAAGSTAARSAEGARYLGRTLADRFVVAGELGHGGMGTVLLAKDVRHEERKVAIKVLMIGLLRDDEDREQFLQRFVREVMALGRINHPNVVRLHDSFDDDGFGNPFYVQEYLEGARTLLDVVRENRRFDVTRAVLVARQMAAGLEASHKEGIIHRDVKPQNVMVLDEDVVKIIDFGLGKDLRSAAAKLTQPGTLAGSPLWLEPAAFDDDFEPDTRTDVYALGLVLSFMLMGTNPYSGLGAGESLMKKKAGPVRIEAALPGCPARLAKIIERATMPARDKRFVDAGEFRQALVDYEVSSLNVGAVIDGKYRVNRQLREGGQGIVYHAEELQPSLDAAEPRQVAVKLMLYAGSSDADASARFQREVRLGQTVAHNEPRLIRVLEVGEWRGRPYFVMELGGERLRDVSTTLTVDDALWIAGEVATALDTLAANGVVHRDVSENNVLVDLYRREVKLCDLGLARELDHDMTRSSVVLGTVGNMAPEQYDNPKQAQPSSDQWALAAIVYRATTGRLPYQDVDVDADEAEARIKERLGSDSTAEIVPPDVLNPTLPSAFSDALMRALSREPTARFSSNVEFVRALRAAATKKMILAHELTQERKKSRRTRTPKRTVGAVAALIAVAGLVTADVILRRIHGGAETKHAAPSVAAPSNASRTAPKELPSPPLTPPGDEAPAAPSEKVEAVRRPVAVTTTKKKRETQRRGSSVTRNKDESTKMRGATTAAPVEEDAPINPFRGQ